MAAAVLARKGVAPLVSEVATRATAFVVVDEAFLSAFFTPRLGPTPSRTI
jgi:hypothetical protein